MSSLLHSNGWHAGFLAVLPAVTTHARIQFRGLRAERREDAIAETVAAACVNFRTAALQGKLAAVHPGPLADFAVRHTREGRHVGGKQEAARDVMSTKCQRRRSITVHSMPIRPGVGGTTGWQQAALEDRTVGVADLAAFRIDFADWLLSQSDRHRRIINELAIGSRTCDVADRFGLSEGRISQLRNRYRHDWQVFQGEAA